ncbi:hypothetical protein ACRAWF_02360 [Streptomyces sp. L7]
MNAAYSPLPGARRLPQRHRVAVRPELGPGAASRARSCTSSTGITGAKISLWPDNGRGRRPRTRSPPTPSPRAPPRPGDLGRPAPRRHLRPIHRTGHRSRLRARMAGPGPGTGGGRDRTPSGRRVPPSDATVQCTTDGYTIGTTADGCLEITGGELTLNASRSSPGVAATPQPCDAAGASMQRWELAPADELLPARERPPSQLALSVAGDGASSSTRRTNTGPQSWRF